MTYTCLFIENIPHLIRPLVTSHYGKTMNYLCAHLSALDQQFVYICIFNGILTVTGTMQLDSRYGVVVARALLETFSLHVDTAGSWWCVHMTHMDEGCGFTHTHTHISALAVAVVCVVWSHYGRAEMAGVLNHKDTFASFHSSNARSDSKAYFSIQKRHNFRFNHVSNSMLCHRNLKIHIRN